MWSLAKALHIPLDPRIKELKETPYTISYTIRKMVQIDNINENLTKEKKPPEKLIWEGTPEELDDWIEDVTKNRGNDRVEIPISEVES
jgi:hypothetical protein